jgi:hypothetical protein
VKRRGVKSGVTVKFLGIKVSCTLGEPTLRVGARGGVVVEALRCKPEGRGFDARWCHWNFPLT